MNEHEDYARRAGRALRRKPRALKCSIRALPIDGWKGGHNAQPVNEGRCCGHCNAFVVIPARIRRMCNKTEI